MSPRVLLLTGPSGAGKSATALAFASSRRSTTAVLDQDLVRNYETFEGDAPVPGALVVDNSQLTIEQTVADLERHLDWP